MSNQNFEFTFKDRASSKRQYTDEGFLVVKDCKLARTGVYHYLDSELGVENPKGEIIGVYRDAKEVFSKDAIRSFENKPVTNDHPSQNLDSSTAKSHIVGVVTNVRASGSYLIGDITVYDKSTIDQIEQGKVELSCGYTSNVVQHDGQYNGQNYEFKQTNITGNHVALVEAGRAGSTVRLSDSQGTESTNVNVNETKGNINMSDELLKQLTDSVEKLTLKLADMEAEKKKDGYKKDEDEDEEKEKKDMEKKESKDSALAMKDAQIDKLQAELDHAKQSMLDAAKVESLVQERVDLVARVTAFDRSIDVSGKSSSDLKKEVLSKHLDSATLEGKSQAYLDARFDALLESKPQSMLDAGLGSFVKDSSSNGQFPSLTPSELAMLDSLNSQESK